MQMIWMTANYLAEQVRSRVRTVFSINKETGALSLEWIVIAVLLVGAATAAGVYFKNAITAESTQLP